MAMNCLITGAGRGIGLEWSRRLLNEGNFVWAASRTLTPELRALTGDFPERARVLALDVGSADINKVLDEVKGPLDLLINNAGILKNDASFGDLNLENVRESFEINTLGPLRVTQALLPKLRQSRQPVVAHVTSLMGSIQDNRGGGYYSYRVSKAALNMFNKSFSIDFPDIISVVLHPGWVRTRMGGEGANISTEESVGGMMKVVAKLSKADTGRFFNYKGEQLPW